MDGPHLSEHDLSQLRIAALRVSPEALHGWLQAVAWTLCRGGAAFIRKMPSGLTRGPADAGRAISIAEELGLVRWSGGYESDPSLVAWNSLSCGGRHPSRRAPQHVEHEVRCWAPGERREVLGVIASMSPEEFAVKLQSQG